MFQIKHATFQKPFSSLQESPPVSPPSLGLMFAGCHLILALWLVFSGSCFPAPIKPVSTVTKTSRRGKGKCRLSLQNALSSQSKTDSSVLLPLLARDEGKESLLLTLSTLAVFSGWEVTKMKSRESFLMELWSWLETKASYISSLLSLLSLTIPIH